MCMCPLQPLHMNPLNLRRIQMTTVTLCEIVEGTALVQYERTVEIKDRVIGNEVQIEFMADNGEVYFLPIPTENFREFVRACQRLLVVLSTKQELRD